MINIAQNINSNAAFCSTTTTLTAVKWEFVV